MEVMKKLILPVLLVFFFSFSVYGQMIESFDGDISTDTTYTISLEGPPSFMNFTTNTTDVKEGTASANVDVNIGAFHEWGSYAQLIKRVPEGQSLMNWAINDSLAIWIKVTKAPSIPANMVFRIHIADRPSENDPIEEYIYEHATILDTESGWVELKIPLTEIESDGSVIPGDQGFVIAPSNWGGFNYNNRKLDFDKIIGFNISAITSGYTPGVNLPADSLKFTVDGFRRFGVRAIPAIVFNGMTLAGNLSAWAWGQSSVGVETGVGPIAGTNALQWIQGNEWGNGWTGMGFTADPTYNLAGAWQQDSVKFKMKAQDGVGALRIQFEGGPGKVGIVFTPVADNQWHSYSFPLRDMVYQDGTSGFDSSSVQVVGMMAEASGVAGKVILITDWWTGNPEFDVIPPIAPTNVVAFAGTFQNVVTWNDVPDETGEKYDVYYSAAPIIDITASGVEVVKLGLGEGVQLIEHLLLAPNTNQSVTYYYAVVCRDFAGNYGPVSASSPSVANTAKGYATVSLNAPTTTFVADGNFTEWTSIPPMRMFPSDGSGYIVTNTSITGDADLSVKAHIAMDANYLYVGLDIEDDVVSFNPNISSYLNDAPDLFIGLYDWHGAPHTSYKRGAQPDYHFRFAKDRAMLDGFRDSILVPGVNYAWTEKFPTGYTVEARISFDDLATRTGDNRFVPLEGMRLPLDFSINDADATGEREGILTFSPYNEDQSWNSVARWLHTWIGNSWFVGVEDETDKPATYGLSQNYPNPFNPSTVINYSVEKPGMVSIKVYDVLGREVADLVNEFKSAGRYNVSFNGSGLASGIYFYNITSGSFNSVRKMMLVK
jgi:hypothetical protein